MGSLDPEVLRIILANQITHPEFAEQLGELVRAGARITELQNELFAVRQKLARVGEMKRVGLFVDVQNLKEKKPHLRVQVVCFDSPRHASKPLLQAADDVHRLGPRDLFAGNTPIRQER